MTDLLLLSVIFWLGIISAIIFSIQCYKERKVKEGKQQKEEYLTSQRSFKACYEVTGSTTEELLNNEADEWYNALTQSNENAENAVITTTIKNKHDKEIKNIEKGLALIKTANQQIQNNDYATP